MKQVVLTSNDFGLFQNFGIIDVKAITAAPVVTASGGTTAFTEGANTTSMPVAIDAGLTVTDGDTANRASASVSITGGFQTSQDVLAFTNQNGISGSYNATSGVLTLTGSATVANYQTALRTVTYTNSSDTPNTTNRTLSFVANDGTGNSSTSTKTVSVTAANDVPVATASGGTTAFTEGTPVAIDTGLTLTDADHANMASATVSITGGFQTSQDVLAFTNQNGISGSYNSTSGVLTLTGSSSTANYQTALRTVTYTNSSDTPNTTNRTLSFVVNDGTGNSSTSTRTVSVTATNVVAYNGNSNTGGTVPTDGSSPYTNGATVTVLGNTGNLTRTGYTFAGWNTAADGSDTDRAAASTFTIASNITLYAKWIDATPPAAPSGFSAVATGDTIALLWTNPADSDFTSCTIRRSTTAFPVSTSDGTAVGSGLTGTSLNDTSLADGTYYYSIFARDTVGNYSTAATASATVDTTPPSAPTLVADKPTATSNTINLSWDVPSSTATFTLQRSLNGGSSSAVFMNAAASVTSYSDTALSDGDYVYSLYALDAAGNVSNAGVSSAVTVDTTAPAAPSLSATKPGATSSTIDLSWNVPSTTATFTIRRSTTSAPTSITDGSLIQANIASSTTSLSQPALADGAYYYAIFALDSFGNVSNPATASATVDTTAPSAPAGFTAVATASTMALSWTNPGSDFSTCSIRRSTSAFPTSITDGIAVSSNLTVTSLNQTGVPDGTYYYAIFALDAVGNISVGATASATVDTTPPDAPAAFTATATGSTIALSWTNPASDFASCTIRRATSGFPATISEGTAVVSSLTGANHNDTGLADGTHYYAIFALDAAGNVSTAAGASATVDTTAPAASAITGLSTDTGTSSSDRITSDTTLVLAGTAEASATVTMSRVGVGAIGTSTADGSGAWSFDYAGTTLLDGGHSFTATATDVAGNTSSASGAFAVTVDTTAPVISSPTTAGGIYRSAFGGYTIAASGAATSYGATGLPTGLSINTGTGAITGTPTQSGAFNVALAAIDAAGNSGNATLVLTVDKIGLTVAGVVAANKVHDGATTAIFVTSGASLEGVVSGDTVTLDAGAATATFGDPSVGTGKTVTIAGLALTGTHAANYSLTQPTTTANITHASATITLGGLSASYDGSAHGATATTNPVGLTVNISYNGSATAPTNVGSHAVVATITDATCAGSANGTLTIAKATQTVDFAAVGGITVDAPVPLSATASSGLPVTFSVISGNATIAGASFTSHDADAITLRASQAGDGNFEPASAEQAMGSIAKASQTITFAQPAAHATTDATFALSATATSGLAVAFAVESGPATLSGNVVTPTGAPGVVAVVASQAGNAAYSAAPSVTRSFAIIAPGELIYFGLLTSGSQNVGTLAGHLIPDGRQGVLIGFLPGQSGGFIVHFTPDASGAFVISITPITAAPTPAQPGHPATAAAPATWTFHGQLSGDTITGTISELSLAFGVAADPVTGPTAVMAGFYAFPSLDTTTNAIYSIVGTEGDVYTLATLSDLVAAGAGTVNGSTGDFVTDLGGGVTLDGNVDAPSTTVDGAIIRPTGSSTDFSGVRSDTTRTDRLINLSSRARVGTGDSVTITGFVIGGTQPKEILLRAVGPGLATYHVTGALADPRLTLIQGGTVLGTNDDWGSAANVAAISAATIATGAFPLGAASKDSALLLTLQLHCDHRKRRGGRRRAGRSVRCERQCLDRVSTFVEHLDPRLRRPG